MLDVVNDPPDGASDIVPSGAGHGILGMRERAELVGGQLRAAGPDGGGFRVTAVLPLLARASCSARAGEPESVARQLTAALAAGVPVGPQSMPVRVSIGLAIGSASSLPAELLDGADNAMYRTKGEGSSHALRQSGEVLRLGLPAGSLA